jgi:hypothetical protein
MNGTLTVTAWQLYTRHSAAAERAPLLVGR